MSRHGWLSAPCCWYSQGFPGVGVEVEVVAASWSPFPSILVRNLDATHDVTPIFLKENYMSQNPRWLNGSLSSSRNVCTTMRTCDKNVVTNDQREGIVYSYDHGDTDCPDCRDNRQTIREVHVDVAFYMIATDLVPVSCWRTAKHARFSGLRSRICNTRHTGCFSWCDWLPTVTIRWSLHHRYSESISFIFLWLLWLTFKWWCNATMTPLFPIYSSFFISGYYSYTRMNANYLFFARRNAC